MEKNNIQLHYYRSTVKRVTVENRNHFFYFQFICSGYIYVLCNKIINILSYWICIHFCEDIYIHMYTFWIESHVILSFLSFLIFHLLLYNTIRNVVLSWMNKRSEMKMGKMRVAWVYQVNKSNWKRFRFISFIIILMGKFSFLKFFFSRVWWKTELDWLWIDM